MNTILAVSETVVSLAALIVVGVPIAIAARRHLRRISESEDRLSDVLTKAGLAEAVVAYRDPEGYPCFYGEATEYMQHGRNRRVRFNAYPADKDDKRRTVVLVTTLTGGRLWEKTVDV